MSRDFVLGVMIPASMAASMFWIARSFSFWRASRPRRALSSFVRCWYSMHLSATSFTKSSEWIRATSSSITNCSIHAFGARSFLHL